MAEDPPDLKNKQNRIGNRNAENKTRTRKSKLNILEKNMYESKILVDQNSCINKL